MITTRLSPTREGKANDFTIFKEEGLPDKIPESVRQRLDSAFQGIKTQFPLCKVSLPTKKPRGRELSNTTKKRNQGMSRVRVLVEHAIGDAKKLGIVSHVFRNKKKDTDDMAMLVTCGLWNYHLVATS